MALMYIFKVILFDIFALIPLIIVFLTYYRINSIRKSIKNLKLGILFFKIK